MLGWFADSLRFVWGLLYWNTRKSWFRFRKGRSACPCQSRSDSGRAYETHCEACVLWHRPERFRRICPLLVKTDLGLRCSADTKDVRPFWGITLRYYGGTLLALYAAAVITVFSLLRTIGYPVSIVHVALPPLWHRVGQARGWFFLNRANQAFAGGRTSEGLLYLANSYEFDPSNYDAGLALAKAYQLGNADKSNEIFAKLLRDHPVQAESAAQQWYRALVARGDFDQAAALASKRMRAGSRYSNVWCRALVFSTAQNHDDRPLRQLVADPAPAVGPWKQLLELAMLVQNRRTAEARAAIAGAWPPTSPPYSTVYRIEALVTLGDPAGALDLLARRRSDLDDEAYWTLRLHCLAGAGAREQLAAEFRTVLLDPPLSQPRLKMMCAQLIRHPDPALLNSVCTKVALESMPLNDATAGGWFSLICTAGAVGDVAQLHALTLRLGHVSGIPFSAVQMAEAFFRGQLTDKRAVSFLPFLPVPLEVVYALIERYPGGPGIALPTSSTNS